VNAIPAKPASWHLLQATLTVYSSFLHIPSIFVAFLLHPQHESRPFLCVKKTLCHGNQGASLFDYFFLAEIQSDRMTVKMI
jgi:hypothetical protein